MKNIYTDHKIFNQLETPLKKLMELNIKTIQGLAFFKPGDFANMRRPEDMIERHMEMLVRNSHMVLDYMRDTFGILENNWLNVAQKTEGRTEHVMREATTAAKRTMKKAVSSTKKALKKSASAGTSAAKTKVSVKAKPKTVAASSVKKTSKKSSTVKSAVKSKARADVKSAVKASAKPAVKKVVKSKAKASVKPAIKAAAKKSAASKPKMTTTVNPVKSQVKTFANQSKHPNMHSKNVGHSMPKVGGIAEKSGIKDLGLLNKGPHYPN